MTYTCIFIIILLLIVNYTIYKMNYIHKNLFININILIILYSIISVSIYYNNIYLNYDNGILFGNVLNNHFCDEYRYYKDSEILMNHLKSGNFYDWITGILPDYEYIDPQGHPGFGNYNIFVIIISLLRILGFNSVLELILIKLFILLITIIFIYKLSNIFLTEKISLVVTIIYSLLPGYILTNTLLMRDNIIILLCIICIYYILKKDYNLFILIPTLIALFLLRAYLPPILLISYIFCYKNTTKLISFKDIIYLAIIFLSVIFFSSVNFNYTIMRIMQENFQVLFGSGLIAPIKVFINTFIHIAIDPQLLNFLLSGQLYLILYSLGNICSNILSILLIIKLIMLLFSNLNNKTLYLLKFTFYFSFITGILVLSKDGYIINRIALMWIPLFLIILFIPRKIK